MYKFYLVNLTGSRIRDRKAKKIRSRKIILKSKIKVKKILFRVIFLEEIIIR
jgi:hypothetical protein